LDLSETHVNVNIQVLYPSLVFLSLSRHLNIPRRQQLELETMLAEGQHTGIEVGRSTAPWGSHSITGESCEERERSC